MTENNVLVRIANVNAVNWPVEDVIGVWRRDQNTGRFIAGDIETHRLMSHQMTAALDWVVSSQRHIEAAQSTPWLFSSRAADVHNRERLYSFIVEEFPGGMENFIEHFPQSVA